MFTPIQTTVGALLLSASTTGYLALNGKILGVSGIIGSTMFSPVSSIATAIPVIVGMLGSVPIVKIWLPDYLPEYVVEGGLKPLGNGVTELVAGFLVGFGTKLGAGCTSGHMLCGLPRLSLRSLFSTATFFMAASLTTNLLSTFPRTTNGVPPITLAPTPALLPLLATLFTPIFALASLRFVLPRNSRLSTALSSAVIGTVFGLGLLVSGMASPGKVLSFLSLRVWEFDPSLVCVVLFAIVPNGFLWWWGYDSISAALHASPSSSTPAANGYQAIDADEAPASPTTAAYIPEKTKPVLCENFDLPTKTAIDKSLIFGSAVFGMGWGLAGICPGPGVLGLLLNGLNGVLYIVGFGVGRGLAELCGRKDWLRQKVRWLIGCTDETC